jgi:hypothetical protein
MYHSLTELESTVDVITTSAAYENINNYQSLQPYVRIIAKVADVPFDNAATNDVNYLIFTQAQRISLSAQKMPEKWWQFCPFCGQWCPDFAIWPYY